MLYKILLLTAFMQLATNLINAQEPDTVQAKSELQEVVVSGSKFNERYSKLAVTIKTINSRDFKRLNISNTANLLEASGHVFVQKSQQGGGSPILRGFEASRVLLMVDGIRMNNAIYRAGHLQNIITVDPFILQRLEILYGPSSTLYGSDALGGVVNMFTRGPILSVRNADTFQVDVTTRYASAINEKTLHADIGYGNKRLGYFTSVTYSDFGDVTIGKKRPDAYAKFGAFEKYIQRINNVDSAIVNTNSNKLKNSGYNQFDILQKLVYKPSDHTLHTINFQLSNSNNIPRFDRLSEVANGVPRFAEWYYGPQKRYVAAYKLERMNLTGLFNELRAVASWQFVEESRYDRRYRQAVRNERIERIHVAGFSIDGRRKMGNHELVVGADAQLNFLKSVAQGFNVNNGAITKITTRYPDGKNNMNYAAVFAQHLFKITPKLTLNDGIRLNYTRLNSRFNDTALLHLPFTTAMQQNVAVSGNAGLAYAPNDQFKIAVVASTGFRAPNVDDLAKVFDTRAGVVVVPNRDLKPEYTFNAELNLVKYFTLHQNPFAARIGGAVYRTWFQNAIVTDAFRFNGQDSITYTGVRSVVLANQNKAAAYLWGWNIYGGISLFEGLDLNATMSYTYGRYKANNKEVPLDHIPPFFGRVGMKYEKHKLYGEFYVMFNGWKRIADYSPSGEDNAQYATAEGMPAWQTFNLRGSYELLKSLQLQVAIENIADAHYRTFASGISAPGRNVIVSLKCSL